MEGKVPGEEEQQIRPRTGAGGSQIDRDGSGKAGGGTGVRGATVMEEREEYLFHPVPCSLCAKAAPSDNPMVT